MTHYNFFLEHSYLGYVTPAMFAGVGEGIQNWGDLIERAIKEPRENPKVVLEWAEEFGVE